MLECFPNIHGLFLWSYKKRKNVYLCPALEPRIRLWELSCGFGMTAYITWKKVVKSFAEGMDEDLKIGTFREK